MSKKFVKYRNIIQFQYFFQTRLFNLLTKLLYFVKVFKNDKKKYNLLLQNNDKLSLVVGRRHVHVKRQQSVNEDEEADDDVDGNGKEVIKTNFPAISHSRSRSEPAIQQSDLEITASEIDSEDSSSDDDEAGMYIKF